MSFKVVVPPSAGPEVVITTATDERRYDVVDNTITVDTEAESDELVRSIEGATRQSDEGDTAPQADTGTAVGDTAPATPSASPTDSPALPLDAPAPSSAPEGA